MASISMSNLTDTSKSMLAGSEFLVPQRGDKVYKEECIYCFDRPESEGGLFVCLSTLFGVCKCHLKLHAQKKNNVFVNFTKIPKTVEVADDANAPPEKKPTKLAIGVEGGFDVNRDKIEYDEINFLIITDNGGNITTNFPLPNSDLPLNVQLSIAAIIAHQGSGFQENIQAWEEKRNVSKHALNLQQLDNGMKIHPSGWKCSLCDLTANLWLNLTDGTILCGRRYFDGSGGNNHAVEYYKQTKYPLAVKLGTINAEGGDVYSYDEDDMVEDPKLKEHLLHFGINVAVLEKTDKTMTELEIEANLSLKAEWDAIQEAGKKLVPLFGPNYTGMINLGNSCYMNSIMQILFSMEEFKGKYGQDVDSIFLNENFNPTQSFNVQMGKLAYGLLSGKYSIQEAKDCQESMGIRPQMFKSLIGHGHVEFSTNHQQDAQEYFLHFLELLEKNEKDDQNKLRDIFTFQFESRLECSSSHKVAYQKREDSILSLPIPLEKATNRTEYEAFEIRLKDTEKKKECIPLEEIVRLNIPMMSCIEAFGCVESIDDFYSSAIKAKTKALKQTRFVTFPDYLVIQLRKFTISEDWTPKKLDVSVDMLEELDLSALRGQGQQAGEELLPEDEGDNLTEPVFNEAHVAQLADMGFPLEACKKAVHFTNNQGVEAAMNWVFEHSQDPDFATPLLLPGSKKKESSVEVSEEGVAMIVSMGFTADQAKKALRKNQNNLETAAEWLFTHMDELNSMDVDEPFAPSQSSQSSEQTYHDGNGKYRLFGFASHMGTSTSCGHYVCHVRKDNRWVIYNDRKVAISETPPKDLGYIYFYKRI